MNVEALAKKAYACLEAASKRGKREADDYKAYFDLLGDNAVLKFGIPEGTPLGGEFRGKQAVVDFFSVTAPELFENVRLEGLLEFVGMGNRVVVLGRETYTIKKTGVVAHSKALAVVLDFRDGQIIRDLQIKEMTEFVDACRIR